MSNLGFAAKPCEQMEADAALIAAAPDLRVRAHQYARVCGDCRGERVFSDGSSCESCTDIWRVIDRAEGRP